MGDIRLPTKLGIKSYLSRGKHHYSSINKKHSLWISRVLEVETFDTSEVGTMVNSQRIEWIDCNGHMWGFIRQDNDIIKVGTKKQQFGYFPAVQNPQSDDWHGYPVFPFKEKNKKYDIGNSLLEFWCTNDILSEDEIATLIEGKLL